MFTITGGASGTGLVGDEVGYCSSDSMTISEVGLGEVEVGASDTFTISEVVSACRKGKLSMDSEIIDYVVSGSGWVGLVLGSETALSGSVVVSEA